jgi:hypothetical protein
LLEEGSTDAEKLFLTDWKAVIGDLTIKASFFLNSFK